MFRQFMDCNRFFSLERINLLIKYKLNDTEKKITDIIINDIQLDNVHYINDRILLRHPMYWVTVSPGDTLGRHDMAKS